MSNLDGLTSGISHTLVLTDLDGLKKFTNLESFSANENADVQDHTDIGGITRHPKLHQGWHGTFVYQRGSNDLDMYFANQERNYYQGGDQINITIKETINELNGTISEFQFTECVLSLTDGGTYSGTTIVKQTVAFKARRKIPV